VVPVFVEVGERPAPTALVGLRVDGVGLALPASWAQHLEAPARVILRLLSAIDPPLILVAVSRALLGADIRGKLSRRISFSWR
jgi:hypothetical protein